MVSPEYEKILEQRRARELEGIKNKDLRAFYKRIDEKLKKGEPVDWDLEGRVEDEIIKSELINEASEEIKKIYKENSLDIISQIWIKMCASESGTPSNRIITEFSDKVELLGFDLDYEILKKSHSRVYKLASKGTMPQEEYKNLFRFIEERNIWEINLCNHYMDGGSLRFFISRGDKKNAFETSGVFFEPTEDESRFLEIGNKFYGVFEKYAQPIR